MTVITIIKRWLKENGYDGLYSYECAGCEKFDLLCCESRMSECIPGYHNPPDADHKYYWIGPKRSTPAVKNTKGDIL